MSDLSAGFRTRHHGRRGWMLLLRAGMLLCLACQPAEAQVVPVRVDAGHLLRPVNPLLYGVNTARWDESLFPGPDREMLLTCDRDAIKKVKESGITLLKYPGGNDADSYIWNSPQNSPTEMSTDEYIAFCRETGAEPFITVNFNGGAELAASWVRYCRDRGHQVRLWEVGDEQWGTWARGHAAPEVYAQQYIQLVKAMRAADPSIRVATNVPLGPHPENWAYRVLKAAGDYVDMLTVTYFPQQWGKENDDSLLASTAAYARLLADLRRDVEAALGKKRADEILYVNVGYNSVNHSPGPQTVQMVNAVWTADMIGTMATSGTDLACFWALHNAFPPRGGDYGLLSSEGSNTAHYSYFVFPLFARHFGNRLVETQCTDPAVSVYAAMRGRTLTLMAINKGKTAARTLAVSLEHFIPRAGIRAWLLDEGHAGVGLPVMPVRGNTFNADLPPYSVTAYEIAPADSVDAPVNLAIEAISSASSSSSIGPHFGPASAIDGIVYTKWNSAAWTKSNGEESQWFQLAWAASQQIARVRILWGDSYARAYRLEASEDGAVWRLIRDVPEGKGGEEEVRFTPVETRYLRLVGTRGTKGISAYSIKEIEAYRK